MYVDVIVPLPLSGLFTYAVPTEMQHNIGRGYRAVVPFGRGKYYTAVITKIHDTKPLKFKTKEIHSLIDTSPVVTDEQLELWEWISFYYLSTQGDVFKAALPAPMLPINLNEGFIPKSETYLQLSASYDTSTIHKLIGRAAKQQMLLDEIIVSLSESGKASISKKCVKELSNYSLSALNGLLQKGILSPITIEISRLDAEIKDTRSPFSLSEEQKKAFNSIQNCFVEKNTILLHGATSSGKTEIYIHLISQQISEGKQTLFLLPEIALTTQLTQRLQAVFGNKIGIIIRESTNVNAPKSGKRCYQIPLMILF